MSVTIYFEGAAEEDCLNVSNHNFRNLWKSLGMPEKEDSWGECDPEVILERLEVQPSPAATDPDYILQEEGKNEPHFYHFGTSMEYLHRRYGDLQKVAQKAKEARKPLLWG